MHERASLSSCWLFTEIYSDSESVMDVFVTCYVSVEWEKNKKQPSIMLSKYFSIK